MAAQLRGNEVVLSDEQAQVGRTPYALLIPLQDWLAVHGNLMLALRHPCNSTDCAAQSAAQIVREVCALLEAAFIESGMLPRELIDQIRAAHAATERAQFGQGKPS